MEKKTVVERDSRVRLLNADFERSSVCRLPALAHHAERGSAPE